MESILNWGIEFILWLQQLHPALDFPFEALTFTGDELFFLVFLPLIYWCFDLYTGAHLITLFALSAYTNTAAKAIFNQPRPYQYDPRVWFYKEVDGGGLPSGHTQNAVTVWGYLASQYRRAWILIGCALLILLVPLSRMYLGVHFPQDIVGGYVLGALLLFAYVKLAPRAEAWLTDKSWQWQLSLTLVIPILMALTLQDENGITLSAVLMGMGAGFILNNHWVKFAVEGVWWKRALRYLLGTLIMVGLWGGLKLAFASLEPAWFFRFIRYSLMGLWGSLGAPWAFIRTGLAQPQ